jgi:hypothetical protein
LRMGCVRSVRMAHFLFSSIIHYEL